MKIIKIIFPDINVQNVLVSVCFLAVCINTQQIQSTSWNSGMIEFCRDSLGVLMAVLLLTHYRWSDFTKYKVPYLVWTALGLMAGVVFVPTAIARRLSFLFADTIVIAFGIFLMGYCVIHTAISFFVEKHRSKFYYPLFLMWVVMLVLMIFSRSSYYWPLCYFVLFLTFYLTDQTAEQRTNVITGMINGMILGYIAIQAHALLCRPYDRLRYVGNFCNPNHNCMFLCMCLAAMLAKILFVVKKGGRKIEQIIYFLMAGTCYSFICMTMCRSGYLATFILTLFFLAAYCRVREKKVFFRTGLLLVSIFMILFPTTYLAARYIPTIHPHVLFYFQEGYSEDRVHSWDARDSEKFVPFEAVLQGIFGRFGNLKNSWKNLSEAPVEEVGMEVENMSTMQLAFSSADFLTAVITTSGFEVQGEGKNLSKIPALTPTEAGNSLIVRYTIYKWYATHLSWRGMPYEDQGFQMTEAHWIQDTHNIYLDYGINYGFPVMILFAIFIWWGIGRLVRKGMAGGECETLACLFITLIPPIFGLFEYSWGAGMLSTVAFYLAFKEMFVEIPRAVTRVRT